MAEIEALRLEYGSTGWDWGQQAGIWANRLEFLSIGGQIDRQTYVPDLSHVGGLRVFGLRIRLGCRDLGCKAEILSEFRLTLELYGLN